jgi:hypothetical protein
VVNGNDEAFAVAAVGEAVNVVQRDRVLRERNRRRGKQD